MAATYSQFRDALLVALARKTEEEGLRDYKLDEVADAAGLEGWSDRLRKWKRPRPWSNRGGFDLR